MLRKRSKLQWMSYLKENFFRKPDSFFLNLNKKKWVNNKRIFFKKRFKKLNIKNYSYDKLLIFRLSKRKRMFKELLKQKHRFKLNFCINKDKKFRKTLRKISKESKKKTFFENTINQRLGTIIFASGLVRNLNIAHILVQNKLVKVNNNYKINPNYVVKCGDTISFDFRVHNYIYKHFVFSAKKPYRVNKKYFRTIGLDFGLYVSYSNLILYMSTLDSSIMNNYMKKIPLNFLRQY